MSDRTAALEADTLDPPCSCGLAGGHPSPRSPDSAAILDALPPDWCGHVGVEEAIAQGQRMLSEREAEIARLREALRSFAELDDDGLNRNLAQGMATAGGSITWKMLDDARAALEDPR
jgi:hypothetical protein